MLKVHLEKQLRDFPLLLELDVQPGEILVLMGKNGAGKSTTLNLISGLAVPDQGNVILDGKTVYDSETGASIPVEERGIGYVFQNSAVFPHMTVEGNIRYGLTSRWVEGTKMKELVDRWCRVMEIEGLRKVKAGSLSGGQRQRVALARALAPSPSLLMLDEPMTALDATGVQEAILTIRGVVAKLGIPCLLVTHRLDDALATGDRICVLENGKIVCSGKAEMLREIYQDQGTFPARAGHCGCTMGDLIRNIQDSESPRQADGDGTRAGNGKLSG